MFKTKEEARERAAQVTEETYYQHGVDRRSPLSGVWSKSELKKFGCDTLAWFANQPFTPSAKMEFGNLVDTMATEPHKFDSTYMVCPETDKRKKAYLEAKAMAEQRNLKIATLKDVTRAENAISALQANAHGRDVLNGDHQAIFRGVVSLKGPLGEVFVPLKSKTDTVQRLEGNSIRIIDLKTTEDPSPDRIASVCRGLSYHWQDALYTVLGRQNGFDVQGFQFVFIGTDEPFHVQSVMFSMHAREQALKSIERTLAMLYWIGHGHPLSSIWPDTLILGSDEFESREKNDYWFTGPDLRPDLRNIEIDWFV